MEELTELESVLTDRLPMLLAEVGDLLSDGWPQYAQFLHDSAGAVEEAGALFIRRLLDTAARGLSHLEPAPLDSDPTAQLVFEQIGRTQWLHGSDLTDLLTAYQVGARVAWRHVSETGLQLELRPQVLSALAEAVFVFVNQLSSASAHGYVQEQSESSGVRERLRQELSELLLSDRSDSTMVQAAAGRAGWPLPELAAVILVDPGDHAARSVIERLDGRCLPVRQPALFGAIVPAPGSGSIEERAPRALRGAHAVVGHLVPISLLPASTHVAQMALDLHGRGLLHGDPVFAADHLDTIIAHRDERLMSVLRQRVLAPLSDLSPSRRRQLIETLAAWLRHMGDRRAIATELHIHPQTVRYRMSQLRTLFGDELDSPTSRARMFLALAWGSVDA